MTYTSVALMENFIKMNVKSLMPSFYFKNYHSFILLNSIIFLILTIPFPTVDDWSLNAMRKLLEYPIMFVLVVLAVSNFTLITLNNLKLDDLNYYELRVIEMLGI